MPLGVPVLIEGDFGSCLEHFTLKLEVGDCFLIYTDGITEAADQRGTQFGLDRLSELLVKSISTSESTGLASVADGIVAQLDDFAGFDKQTDDITFVVALATSDMGTPIAGDSKTSGFISVDDPTERGGRGWSE